MLGVPQKMTIKRVGKQIRWGDSTEQSDPGRPSVVATKDQVHETKPAANLNVCWMDNTWSAQTGPLWRLLGPLGRTDQTKGEILRSQHSRPPPIGPVGLLFD